MDKIKELENKRNKLKAKLEGKKESYSPDYVWLPLTSLCESKGLFSSKYTDSIDAYFMRGESIAFLLFVVIDIAIMPLTAIANGIKAIFHKSVRSKFKKLHKLEAEIKNEYEKEKAEEDFIKGLNEELNGEDKKLNSNIDTKKLNKEEIHSRDTKHIDEDEECLIIKK